MTDEPDHREVMRQRDEAQEKANNRAGFWIVVALVALIGGCSWLVSSDSDDDGPSVSKTTEATVSVDDRYLAAVRQIGSVSGVTDAALLDAGHQVCGALDRGGSMASVALMGTSTAGDSGGAILGAAVPAFCPRYQATLDAFVARYGR